MIMPGPTIFPSLLGVLIEAFRDKFDQPRIGSVVYCDLFGELAAHSGIYIGRNKIVSVSGSVSGSGRSGSGKAVKESPREFTSGGTGSTIYVSCKGASPVGDPHVAERALKMVGKSIAYDVVGNNCHRFTFGCLTGDFKSENYTLFQIRMEAEKRLGGDDWRVWDWSD